MSRVFWDTNLFIYLIEGTGSLGRRTRALTERMKERGDHLFASTISLGEVLVRPVMENNDAMTDTYEALFARNVNLVPFDSAAARRYAHIRRNKTIRQPDAILLACAVIAKANFFITNDEKLARQNVPEIEFIVTLDRSPI